MSWAGAVMIWAGAVKAACILKLKARPADRPTGRPTDRQTDQPTLCFIGRVARDKKLNFSQRIVSPS